MSYNVYMEIDTGGAEWATVDEVGNMTSNVSPMWAKALGFPLANLHGQTGVHAIPALERAVSVIRHPANIEAFRALNPTNGWGSHESAAEYLEKLLAACRRHPKATISISR